MKYDTDCGQTEIELINNSDNDDDYDEKGDDCEYNEIENNY